MIAYITRRLLLMFPLLLGITLITFLILHAMPGDPAETLAGMETTGEIVERIRHDLGLDKPPTTQYFIFLKNLLKGDFGYSYRTRQPVMNELIKRLPYTFMLAGASLGVAIIAGFLLGILSAINRDSIIDRIISMILLVGLSTPTFWIGLLFILFFAVNLGWFPAGGYSGLRSLIMPAMTMAIPVTAIISRLVRTSLLEVLGENYIKTAMAKGVPPFQIITRHALRNALIPVVTVVGLLSGEMLGGSVVVETVFGWPGMGQTIVTALYARDYMMVQGAILLLATAFILINIFVDILYTYLDPRINYV
jgi:peptide/nickel transport system permease protein